MYEKNASNNWYNNAIPYYILLTIKFFYMV